MSLAVAVGCRSSDPVDSGTPSLSQQVIECFGSIQPLAEAPKHEQAMKALSSWLQRRKFKLTEAEKVGEKFNIDRSRHSAGTRDAYFIGTLEGSDPFLVQLHHVTTNRSQLSARVVWFAFGPHHSEQEKACLRFSDLLSYWWALNDPFPRDLRRSGG